MVSGKSTECRVEGIVSVKRKVWDVNHFQVLAGLFEHVEKKIYTYDDGLMTLGSL